MSLRTLSAAGPIPARPLNVEQSSGSWKFAEMLAKASEVMGSQRDAEEWLKQPAIGLNGRQAHRSAGDAGRCGAGRALSGPDRIRGLCVIAPLPGPLGGTELVAWRLDARRFAATWDSGEGAYRFGGRWSSVACAPSIARSMRQRPFWKWRCITASSGWTPSPIC